MAFSINYRLILYTFPTLYPSVNIKNIIFFYQPQAHPIYFSCFTPICQYKKIGIYFLIHDFSKYNLPWNTASLCSAVGGGQGPAHVTQMFYH